MDDDEEAFAAVGDLRLEAALAWAADCVEHLALRVGDTPGGDVAACVGLARKYAQDHAYDEAAAHARSSAVRHARRKQMARPGGVVGRAVGVVASLAFWEDVPSDSGRPGYVERERELEAELERLLDAAEKLCGADPLAAAQDASSCCRKAAPTETSWQLERLENYLDGAHPVPSSGLDSASAPQSTPAAGDGRG